MIRSYGNCRFKIVMAGLSCSDGVIGTGRIWCDIIRSKKSLSKGDSGIIDGFNFELQEVGFG